MKPTRDVFLAQRHRRFGRSNPERFRLELWDWILREGIWPYRLREAFDAGPEPDGEPEWSIGDMGFTRTELPDGRVVRVGGEHEDFYDPDFCIYNHVIVEAPGAPPAIFGYPRDVFPPTDFHTATLVDGRIVIVGCLGYLDERRAGTTPVFSLDTETYRITPVPTSGTPPGWIFDHSATLDPGRNAIDVSGGKLIEIRDDQPLTRHSVDEFRLHLDDGRWERLTDRSDWIEVRIDPEHWDPASSRRLGRAELDSYLLPRSTPHEIVRRVGGPSPDDEDEDLLSRCFEIDGITIRTRSEHFCSIGVLIEGPLPGPLFRQLIDDLRSGLEAIIDGPSCKVTLLAPPRGGPGGSGA